MELRTPVQRTITRPPFQKSTICCFCLVFFLFILRCHYGNLDYSATINPMHRYKNEIQLYINLNKKATERRSTLHEDSSLLQTEGFSTTFYLVLAAFTDSYLQDNFQEKKKSFILKNIHRLRPEWTFCYQSVQSLE